MGEEKGGEIGKGSDKSLETIGGSSCNGSSENANKHMKNDAGKQEKPETARY